VATETEMLPSSPGVTVGIGRLETSVGGGGMTPESPVPNETAVLPAIVMLPLPPVEEIMRTGVTKALLAGGITPDPPVELATSVLLLVTNDAAPDVPKVLAGGIIPESPVPFVTNVLLLVAKEAPPDVTDTVTVTTVVLPGGTMPESPVLTAVPVDPETVNAAVPPETRVELETS
jgi:hypothetical protein